jgi:ATP-binding protein involved in chromosome partitioning
MPLPMFKGKSVSRDSQASPLQAQELHSSIKYTIGVASGKGGVGKSTVTVNLALALKQKGYSVGILDADIYGPSLRRLLPEDRMPEQNGERFRPALSHGIRIISMAYFRKEHEAAAIRAPIANSLTTQFIQQVDWGELDFLLIDFPPGTGDIQLTLSQKAAITAAVMVTTPQEVAIMDVKKAMHLFHQVQIPILGVIENMSGMIVGDEWVYPFGKGGGAKLAQHSGVPFLGAIPIDPLLCLKSDRGESIMEGNSPAAVAFKEVVETALSHLNSLDQEGLENFEISWKDMK